jgi:hypothetical protein
MPTWSSIGLDHQAVEEDMERSALGSYAMDYNTFGTMSFHEVMWG